MSAQSDGSVSRILERLQPFAEDDAFGGIELRSGDVHLYVVGGAPQARRAGMLSGDPTAQPTVHPCRYSRNELLAEVRRLAAVVWDAGDSNSAGVVSMAPQSDAEGLHVVCRLASNHG